MRKMLFLMALVLAIPSAFAGGYMWYNLSLSTRIGLAFLMVLYFALATFIFSVIFWLTHNWLVKEKKKRR